jgi:HD superfamily phosphohydrolase
MSSDETAERAAHLIARVPEIGLPDPSRGTVRIPELRNVALTRRVREVVDHPAFQRLRRVRQLGPTHLVYPGATHTRFEHSLGVYSCVRLYLLNLFRTPAFAASVTEEDILTVLAAGLLHDVGHYPFAHNLEALHLKGRDTPRHEEVGGRILQGEIEPLRGDRTIASILKSEWGVDARRVNALCTGDFDGEPDAMDQVLHSIVSSAIDADKMDYLERDSIHLGVPYGRNYDRDRLLASLTLNDDETSIAVLAKGKVSAEIFVFGRYTMFSEAYWHHTVRSAAAMVEAALAAFGSRSDIDGDQMLDVLIRHDDDAFLNWLRDQTPEGSATHYLVDGLIGNTRRLYKRVATFSRIYVEEEKQAAYERIYQMNASEVYDLADRLRARLSYLVERPLHPADVIIDTPPRDKDRMETVEVVYGGGDESRHYQLHELSRVVAGIQDDFVKVVKKIRIFAAPKLAAELADVDDVYEIILDEIL